jgi:hypothetical protein
MPKSSDENLRLEIRARLASGALFPTGRRIFAGKGTGKPCIVCGSSIAPSEIEHEIVGPTTVWAHWDCYSIWRQESDALAKPEPSPAPARTTRLPLHINRLDPNGVDSATAEYAVSMGGAKDGVGTVLLGKPRGLRALTSLLQGLEVPSAEIETACRALVEQSHHEIRHVNVTTTVLRRLRL